MSRCLGQVPIGTVLDRLELLDRERGRLHLEMLAAALQAADPEAATTRALAADPIPGTVTIIALGKAAPAMARGAVTVLGDAVTGGVVVSNHSAPLPAGLELILTGHPTPDERSLEAGRRLLETAAAPPASRILFLISGGGSALAEVPAPGLSLADIAGTVGILLASGVPIDEVNTVRTHLSALKGGRLAAASPAPATSILISDVPAGATHVIASGPTVACPTTPDDALAIIERRGLVERLPQRVVAALVSAVPPPPVTAAFTIAADGLAAAEAAVAAARARGVPSEVAPTPLTGSASITGQAAVVSAPDGVITVMAGETTVEVRGPGQGGRNQEAALAACLAVEMTSTMLTTFGTDGVDGPTDAAGAVVDGATAARLRAGGVDAELALATNDSYPALNAAGALIRCGPTGTNVADIWLVDRR